MTMSILRVSAWKRSCQKVWTKLKRTRVFQTSGFIRRKKHNASGPLNREGITDLPLLRTLLVFRQKSREQSFWAVMECFVLVAYVSLAVTRTLLQRLLACLNFTFDSEDLFCWYKRKNDFYQLRQEHKPLKTIETNEA